LGLAELSFEQGSKLSRIGFAAFMKCSSLRQITIPSQLEIIPPALFLDCESLCQIIFEPSSRLKRLDLPTAEFGSLNIPDSVEIVSAVFGTLEGQSRLLRFGRESRLREILPNERWAAWRTSFKEGPTKTLSLHLSEDTLRRFHCQFESF
jgi:hypothetical protein